MKTRGVTSVLLMTLVLGGSSTVEAQVLQPNQLCSDHRDAAITTFEDANLEARVRSALSIGSQDDLTCGPIGWATCVPICVPTPQNGANLTRTRKTSPLP